jgi:hypothetical protein
LTTSCRSTGTAATRSRAGFLAGQHQQLLDQAYRAVYALVEPGDAGLAFGGRVAVAAQGLGLQLERRQRRTQLVRRVGHKMFLCLEGAAHAAEQQVELVHQRPHLVGQPFGGQRRQIIGAAARHLAPGPLYGRQRAADDPPDGQHQQRRQQHKRHHGAHRQRARAGRARVQVLGDLHGLQRCLQGVDAVAVAVGLDVGKPQHRTRRQRRAGGAEDLRAVQAPDLHIDLEAVVVVGLFERQVQGHAAAQRARHLLQVLVEHRIGLPQRTAVGGAGLQNGRAQDGGEHKPEQPFPEGMGCRLCHCLGTR